MVPKEKVAIVGHEHHIYTDGNTGSGKPIQRSMCRYCGTPVTIIEAHAPDTYCIQQGIFVDHELPPPKLEMFRSQACG